MRIACPGCDAAYEVPDRLLAGGTRPMRCTRCGRVFALPAAAPAGPPAQVSPGPIKAEPVPQRPAPVAPAPALPVPVAPARQAPRHALLAAWIGSVAAVAALCGALLVWRGEIASAWPPAARLYAALGLG